MDSLNIGPCPCNVDPVQIGEDNYPALARKECNRYIKQLRKMHGDEPVGAKLYVKSNPHDFGTYYEVECRFDPDCQEAVEYAYLIEANCPEEWDD